MELLYFSRIKVKLFHYNSLIKAHSGSGLGFRILIDYFGDKDKLNIKKDNIRTACISYAENTRFTPPNYFCLITNDVWFPWGKG